ncbi:hypothetical protein evm_001893 [Chilo suppressalis]|nr:hypothetical protein evm_001893 [Chilo suppressalis]
MKEFKYDIVELIHAVRDRPCLWDKTLEVYKDRFERRKAWEEIFSVIDEEYESMSNEERRLTGENVLNKWTNIRDTFVKSLRPKMGKPRRKYILHDHLQFLLKGQENVQYEEQEDEVTYLKEENASEEETVPRKRSKRIERSDDDDSYTPNTSKIECSQSNKRRSKKKDSVDAGAATSNTKAEVSGNEIDFVEVTEINQGADHNRLMNEDEAFFASLLPTVVKYTEDERLEFRIEVLGIMKRIKEARKWCVVEVA